MIPDATLRKSYDAVVVGGGFYGCSIAVHLAREHQLPNVLLLEREHGLLTRASFRNQARIHNGYHYPRSFTTAYRSRVNLPRFLRDWPSAVRKDFTKLYAIARQHSRVNARQFRRFCAEIGARLAPADARHKGLFDSRLVEDVFLAEEYVFDATELARQAEHELAASGVQVRLGLVVDEIRKAGLPRLHVTINSQTSSEIVATRHVVNCTYSGLNHLRGDFAGTSTRLKHQITEMALIQMPEGLQHLGITVMDGPFFSTMPFPPNGGHTLSHVRYTPHVEWQDEVSIDPYRKLAEFTCSSRADRMLRDAARFMPAIADAQYERSLFEVKTILCKNAGDDGRPILFESHPELPGCHSILGGKIDNIYDVLQKLSSMDFSH